MNNVLIVPQIRQNRFLESVYRPQSQVDRRGQVSPVDFSLFMTDDRSRARCCVNRTARIAAAYRRQCMVLHHVPQPPTVGFFNDRARRSLELP